MASARHQNSPDDGPAGSFFADILSDENGLSVHRFRRFTANGTPDIRVRAAQLYLKYQGIDPGPVDGDLGNRTRTALELFQQRQALPETGAVDDRTPGALRQLAQ